MFTVLYSKTHDNELSNAGLTQMFRDGVMKKNSRQAVIGHQPVIYTLASSYDREIADYRAKYPDAQTIAYLRTNSTAALRILNDQPTPAPIVS